MSQLRVNEFVNSDDNGAPSFPNSATTIPPTESDQFATKLYVDENPLFMGEYNATLQ